MGKWLADGNAKKEGSLIEECYRHGVPIFVPAFSDCSAGFGLVKHQVKRTARSPQSLAMRAFKVCLFNQYCNQVLEQVYADSLKYNMVAQCQKLRNLNQYFQFNPATMNI